MWMGNLHRRLSFALLCSRITLLPVIVDGGTNSGVSVYLLFPRLTLLPVVVDGGNNNDAFIAHLCPRLTVLLVFVDRRNLLCSRLTTLTVVVDGRNNSDTFVPLFFVLVSQHCRSLWMQEITAVHLYLPALSSPHSTAGCCGWRK